MRHPKLSPVPRGLIVAFVFAAIIPLMNGCSRKSPHAKCQVDWGEAQVSNGCLVQSGVKGEPSQLRFQIPKWDLKKENAFIEVTGQNLGALEGLSFSGYAGDNKLFTYTMPLYGDPHYNLIQDNIQTSLSLPMSQAEVNNPKNLKVEHIRLYLKSKPGASLSLSLGKIQLRKKPEQGFVSFTFDDGYDEHHKAAMALYSRGFKGTFYTIPDLFDQKSYLTTEQVKAIQGMGSDISSHHQTPATELENLKSSLQVVQDKIKNVVGKNESLRHFAWPLGKFNKTALPAIRKLFASARLAGGGAESLPPANLHRLRVFNVIHTMSPEVVLQQISKSVERGDWLILMFHYFDQPDKGELNYKMQDLESLLSKIKQKNLPVKSVNEALKTL